MAIDQRLGKKERLASDCANLGLVHARQGDWDCAEQMLRRALAIHEELDQREAIANDCSSLGLLYQLRHQPCEARQMWLRAKDLYAEAGINPMVEKLEMWLNEIGRAAEQ